MKEQVIDSFTSLVRTYTDLLNQCWEEKAGETSIRLPHQQQQLQLVPLPPPPEMDIGGVSGYVSDTEQWSDEEDEDKKAVVDEDKRAVDERKRKEKREPTNQSQETPALFLRSLQVCVRKE